MEIPQDAMTALKRRKAKQGKEMPSDYILYVTACNEKVAATRDQSFTALPEHQWRVAAK